MPLEIDRCRRPDGTRSTPRLNCVVITCLHQLKKNAIIYLHPPHYRTLPILSISKNTYFGGNMYPQVNRSDSTGHQRICPKVIVVWYGFCRQGERQSFLRTTKRNGLRAKGLKVLKGQVAQAGDFVGLLQLSGVVGIGDRDRSRSLPTAIL